MTEKKLLVGIASLLTTALDNDPTPLGVAYAAFMASGYSFDDFRTCTRIMSSAGLAVCTTETMTLTDAGRAKARQFNHLLQAQAN